MRTNRAKHLVVAIAGAGVMALAMGTSAPSSGQELTVTSWGGSFQAAQRKVYFEPFVKETGIKIREDEWATGSMALIETQVQSGKITWDVIDTGKNAIISGCEQGLLEPIDINALGGADRFIDGMVYECGIQTTVVGTIPSYNSDKFPGKKPAKLEDLWDLKNFPGKRGLRKTIWTLSEITLIADGVAPDKVYDVLGTDEGINRVFKKLDTIKDDVIWWKSNAEGIQLLVDGEVAMGIFPNGRVIDAAEKFNKPLELIWDGAAVSGDIWGIVKGTPRMKEAMEFLKYVNRCDVQMEWPKNFNYGAPLKCVVEKTSPDIGRKLITDPNNQKRSWHTSSRFWADYQEDYAQRFAAWLAK